MRLMKLTRQALVDASKPTVLFE